MHSRKERAAIREDVYRLLKFHDSYIKMMQSYKERLETARKSERKWQRTLNFNGLCG